LRIRSIPPTLQIIGSGKFISVQYRSDTAVTFFVPHYTLMHH
jgi:hypothetical protein